MKAQYMIRITSSKTSRVINRQYYRLRDMKIAKWAIFDSMIACGDKFTVELIDNNSGIEIVMQRFETLSDWEEEKKEVMTGEALFE